MDQTLSPVSLITLVMVADWNGPPENPTFNKSCIPSCQIDNAIFTDLLTAHAHSLRVLRADDCRHLTEPTVLVQYGFGPIP